MCCGDSGEHWCWVIGLRLGNIIASDTDHPDLSHSSFLFTSHHSSQNGFFKIKANLRGWATAWALMILPCDNSLRALLGPWPTLIYCNSLASCTQVQYDSEGFVPIKVTFDSSLTLGNKLFTVFASESVVFNVIKIDGEGRERTQELKFG